MLTNKDLTWQKALIIMFVFFNHSFLYLKPLLLFYVKISRTHMVIQTQCNEADRKILNFWNMLIQTWTAKFPLYGTKNWN